MGTMIFLTTVLYAGIPALFQKYGKVGEGGAQVLWFLWVMPFFGLLISCALADFLIGIFK